VETRTATDWEPYEVSLVPMPADPGARVRGGEKLDTNTCVMVTRDGQEQNIMAEQNTTAVPAAAPAAVPAAVPVATLVVTEAERSAAVGAERARILDVQNMVRVANLPASLAQRLVSEGVTVDAARAQVLEQLAQRSAPIDGHIEVGADARDKFMRGMFNWLAIKSGQAATLARHMGVQVTAFDPGEFRGFSLLDIAREALERAGQKTRGLDKMALVAQAFTFRGMGAQTTSDFAVLFENIMHKVLQAAYAVQPDRWPLFCAQGVVSDFRPHARFRLGSFSVLDALKENGEFRSKALPDAEKATITAATKGNIVAISRQSIVNDDLGAFARLMTMLGRAAARTIERDVFALLAENGGLGPDMADGKSLFHADHGNVGTGAALSAASIDGDRVKMASQMDKDSNDYLDLTPAVLLLASSLGGQARVINTSQYDPDTLANKAQQKPNVVAGLYAQIVDTPRISGTRRYSFADPGVAPVIEVAFLEGQQGPVLETKDGWDVDGAEMKVRFDYGVAGVDTKGAVTNAGV
jgi:hypothetical protein